MEQLTLIQDWPTIEHIEIPQPQVITENDLPEPYEEVQERQMTQKEVILDLLENMDFVPTKSLSSKIYQYNTRIKELRKKGYDIESVRQDGVYGFRLN